jgi:DNA-binding NtrC family response regulator
MRRVAAINDTMYLSSMLAERGCMKKVLIIDERSFSHICSAILEEDGHKTEVLEAFEGLLPKVENKDFRLVITSYPFCQSLFERIKSMGLPTIVLTDHINRSLINLLEGYKNSYCMVKPLDYQKFRSLVKQIVNRSKLNNGLTIL